jgi:hypothetical protein
MNNEPTIPTTTETITTPCDRRFFPSLCWSAIIGGTVAAIGIQILLSILGTGAGLAIFAPMTDNNPVKDFSEGAAATWSICALIALFFGAVIAGRFSHSMHGGFVHGILVWCLTLIISLVLLTAGTGVVMGGVLKVLGEGLGIGGKAVAAGTGALTKEGVKRSSDQLGSFIDEAVQSIPTNAAPKAATRAKREIGFAVTKLFAPGNDISSQDNRTAAIKSLVDYAQMTEADATTTVDGWVTSYKNLKTELDNLKAMAEQKAKIAADEAAHNLSITAIWAFFGLLLGLLVSVAGGILGADHAMRRVKAENVRLTQLSAK